jgi:type I restriction enzyme S subunit
MRSPTYYEQPSLGDVCDVFAGNAWPSKEFNAIGDGLPVIRIQNVGTDGNEDTVYWNRAYDERFLIHKGDLLLSLSGSFRVAVWGGSDALLNQRVVKLTPGARLNRQWLHRVLEHRIDHIERMGKHALVNNVSLADLRAFRIPLPPLPEQKRIADILDKADAIRRKRREASKLLADYPLVLFFDMFGHPDVNPRRSPLLPFSKVCDSRLGKMLDAKQQIGQHNRPYMRNLNVQWGQLDLSRVFEMDFDQDDRQELRLEYGDVLICEGGAGVGQTAIWRAELPECYFQKSLHRARPYPDLATPEYIAYLMWTLMRGSSLLRSISSATIPHLTGEKLREVRIPVPPLPLQKHFSRQCALFNSTTEKTSKGMRTSDELFNSIVHKAFRGEL